MTTTNQDKQLAAEVRKTLIDLLAKPVVEALGDITLGEVANDKDKVRDVVEEALRSELMGMDMQFMVDAVNHVLTPDEVFSVSDLETWAENNNWVQERS